MEPLEGSHAAWKPSEGTTKSETLCSLSVQFVEVEQLTASPVLGLDEVWNSMDGKKIKRVPLLRLYGSTTAGQKCSVNIHNAYPYFFVNIPESVLQLHDTYEKLSGYAIQLAQALNKAVHLNLAAKSLDAQYIHLISLVQAKPFYGYTPDNELFFKVFIYNPLLVTRITTLLRNKAVMGVSFRIFESHIPYNLQFCIDYKIYGMGFVNFKNVKFRLPLPEARKREFINLNESLPFVASQGAQSHVFHSNDSVPNDLCLSIPKDTRSELEVDVDVTDILEPSSGAFSSPNTSGFELPEQLVPSLAYMWEDERKRRYEAAKLANPGISPASQSLGLGSTFDSTHERLVDGPHQFHKSILDRFQKLVEKDETNAKALFSETEPLYTPISSSISRHNHLSETPMAATKFKVLSQRLNQQLLDVAFRAASQSIPAVPIVDEELASSQASDQSLLEALEWMKDDDWENIDWESKIGRESDTKLHGYPQNEEEESIMNDREVEDILASQRELLNEISPPALDDLLSEVPRSDKKRDREEHLTPELERIDAIVSQQTRKKKVRFSETAHLLLFNENDLFPYQISETATSGSQNSEETEQSSNQSNSSIEPPVSSETLMSNATHPMSSQDDRFMLQDTQQPLPLISPSQNASVAHLEGDLASKTLDKDVLSVEDLTVMTSKQASSSFVNFFSRRLVNAQAQASVAPIPFHNELPISAPLQSSGTEAPTEKAPSLELPSIPGLLESSPVPSSASVASEHLTPRGRRPLVLKYHLPPPSWQVIKEGMIARNTPMIRYRGPYYGNPLDKPSTSSKFAGISISVESVDFDALPPFDLHYIPPTASSASLIQDYHELGAKRQGVRKKGRDGLLLRAITPAKPPPLVYSFESDKSATVEEVNDEKVAEDDYELISNSPKLGEQFRLVAGVRSLPGSKKSAPQKKNIQEILEEDNRAKRRNTFSQTEPSSLASQIDRSAPSNPHGFSLRPEARRNLGGKGLEGLTMLSLEVFSSSNGPLRADPRICPVEAIYCCWRDDFEVRRIGPDLYQDHLEVLCLKRISVGSVPSHASDLNRVKRHEFQNEMDLLLGFRDFLVKMDPDIVMGYECQQNSLGFIFERSVHLGITDYIPSFGRSGGELGNNFDIAADSWAALYQSGISMVGRIVFNVWRIMRSELALQSYSFESIAYHVLHQRIPHFDHVTLTKWYSGVDDLGPAHVLSPPKTPTINKGRHSTTSDSHSMDIDQQEEIQIENDPSDPSQAVAESDTLSQSATKIETTSPKEKVAPELKEAKKLHSDFSQQIWPAAPDRWRVDYYYFERAQCNFYLLDALNVVSRTSEFARMYGITFYSVLSRGSQYRVESLMLRMTKPQNYVCVSPTRQQVAQQLAPESIPLVMEPLSQFYPDPVLVLDFQSLYPSVMIGYNLCFSTCLGRIDGTSSAFPSVPTDNNPIPSLAPTTSKRLGVINYEMPVGLLSSLKNDIYCAANSVMYVKPELRTGTISRMLHEILETRVMVKESMKLVKKSDPITWSLLDSRQLGLKMIAALTYGYTSASFSGRMPCVDLADSIVQTARETLERAIKLINSTSEWGAKVVYGDTDSVFVLLKGATKERAFQVGQEIASRVTDDNPWPIKLKFEKCYHPCALLAKKRYVGYSYESVDQETPIFDAKGIETVRRDTCPAVSKILEKSLRMLFEYKDLSLIKSYLRNQWTKILTGRVSLVDFIFRKEVRLGTYRGHHAPPAALVAMKEMEKDPRAVPRYGERVPYLVINGTAKARLIDLVFHPLAVTPDSGMSINANYYITRNIIPVLSRVFNLFGVSIADWFQEMPKKFRHAKSIAKKAEKDTKIKKHTIDQYYPSQYCPICDTLCATPICETCMSNPPMAVFILTSRLKIKKQKAAQILEICMQCSSNPGRSHTIDCDSLDCPVFYQRVKYTAEANAVAQYQSILDSLDFTSGDCLQPKHG